MYPATLEESVPCPVAMVRAVKLNVAYKSCTKFHKPSRMNVCKSRGEPGPDRDVSQVTTARIRAARFFFFKADVIKMLSAAGGGGKST